MNNNLFDILKEMINLNTINKQNLPQVNQSLQNIVKAQDQVRTAQQKMMQQQMKPQPGMQPQQSGMTNQVMREIDDVEGGSPQGLGPSKGMEPKSLPSDPTPTMGTPTTPMGMKTMAADSIPILEDGDTVKMELEDHIDELMLNIYGFTYFKDRNNKSDQVVSRKDIPSLFPMKQQSLPPVIPCYKTMDDNGRKHLANDRIIQLLNNGNYKTAFTDLIRKKETLNEENFVKSKMFSIIAENETPRITKRDFINYIKKR